MAERDEGLYSRRSKQTPSGRQVIVRVIARLNIGGPSIQAITLTQRLEDRGFDTILVRGTEGTAEGSMDHLARSLGVRPLHVSQLRRDPTPVDLIALWRLIRLIRRARPSIVHTHAAKAGTLGRLAALLASIGRDRPLLVHTFHGHSLTGYFSGRKAATYRGIERWLARHTDRLIAVSSEVRDDLVALGVAPSRKFTVVPLGFDLSPFMRPDAVAAEQGRSLRAEIGVAADALLVTLVARLVPIKRVDRFLALARALADIESAHFLIVGDGPLRAELQSSGADLSPRLRWAGFRTDVPAVCFASDVVVLTSANEGTPVSLIEAQAAKVPVVCTAVGGARTVVRDGQTGFVVDGEDAGGLADVVRRLLESSSLRGQMGSAGRRHVVARFDIERLIDDLLDVYGGADQSGAGI